MRQTTNAMIFNVVRKLMVALYILIVVCMGLNQHEGWWFVALWAGLAACGAAWCVHRRMRRPSLVLLHASFLVILAGALLSHVTSFQGLVHVRVGETAVTYLSEDAVTLRQLPFQLRLEGFEVQCHEGTKAVKDYVSRFTVYGAADEDTVSGRVSMNRVFNYHGVRLCQSGYDADGMGSTLGVGSDPYGTPVTYLGYALLFVGLLWEGKRLVRVRGVFRGLRALRVLRALGVLGALGALGMLGVLGALRIAESPQLLVNYNDRICPLETFALDFTKTLCGSRSYDGHDAMQVFMGFALDGETWSQERLIRIKSGEVRERLHLSKYVSLNDLFARQGGGYVLGPALQEYYGGNSDAFHRAVAELDDKVMLVMQVKHHSLLRLFPWRGTWYAPTDSLPATMDAGRQAYIRNALPLLAELERGGEKAKAAELLAKMQRYQQRYGAEAIPSQPRLVAERVYNALSPALLFGAIGLILLAFIALWRMIRKGSELSESSESSEKSDCPKLSKAPVSAFILSLAWGYITLLLALRWVISGTVPMSNGYETMLMLAWTVLLLSLLMRRRHAVMQPFGSLLAGFFLLVSHLSLMSPQISHIMPVLRSPLLTLHVSVIMVAYALLGITALCALLSLVRVRRMPHGCSDPLTTLSWQLLYPAVACLAIGIFIGAVWADISWGSYWSWDPKETWALITLMLYAVPLHQASLPVLRAPRAYHAYMLLAFLSVLMTYFGVNYVLGGMHSYA